MTSNQKTGTGQATSTCGEHGVSGGVGQHQRMSSNSNSVGGMNGNAAGLPNSNSVGGMQGGGPMGALPGGPAALQSGGQFLQSGGNLRPQQLLQMSNRLSTSNNLIITPGADDLDVENIIRANFLNLSVSKNKNSMVAGGVGGAGDSGIGGIRDETMNLNYDFINYEPMYNNPYSQEFGAHASPLSAHNVPNSHGPHTHSSAHHTVSSGSNFKSGPSAPNSHGPERDGLGMNGEGEGRGVSKSTAGSALSAQKQFETLRSPVDVRGAQVSGGGAPVSNNISPNQTDGQYVLTATGLGSGSGVKQGSLNVDNLACNAAAGEQGPPGSVAPAPSPVQDGGSADPNQQGRKFLRGGAQLLQSLEQHNNGNALSASSSKDTVQSGAGGLQGRYQHNTITNMGSEAGDARYSTGSQQGQQQQQLAVSGYNGQSQQQQQMSYDPHMVTRLDEQIRMLSFMISM